MLGLKRNEVKLVDHDPKWEVIASQIIKKLWKVFGSNMIALCGLKISIFGII